MKIIRDEERTFHRLSPSITRILTSSHVLLSSLLHGLQKKRKIKERRKKN